MFKRKNRFTHSDNFISLRNFHTIYSVSQVITKHKRSAQLQWNTNWTMQTACWNRSPYKQWIFTLTVFLELPKSVTPLMVESMKTDKKASYKIWHSLSAAHCAYKAAAPEMISMSSLVMTACRVRLNVNVSLSIISPARKISSQCYTCSEYT